MSERSAALKAELGRDYAQSTELFELSKEYCLLHATAACVLTFVHSHDALEDPLPSGALLLLQTGAAAQAPVPVRVRHRPGGHRRGDARTAPSAPARTGCSRTGSSRSPSAPSTPPPPASDRAGTDADASRPDVPVAAARHAVDRFADGARRDAAARTAPERAGGDRRLDRGRAAPVPRCAAAVPLRAQRPHRPPARLVALSHRDFGRPGTGARPRRALRFNLSHTEGLIACVVTQGRGCGVDVGPTPPPTG